MPAHDARQQDVDTYLRRAAERPPLRTWMAVQGITTDEFVVTLAAKSAQNSLYLDYVLADIERGLYQGVRLEHLPAGLEGYYEEQWRRRGMTATPLPQAKITLVYILAEVRHPVSRQLLAEFAHEAELTVQAVLDEWQPFLQAQQVEGALRYRVYHSSFRAFLTRQDIMQAAGVTLPEIHARIANSLWEALYGPE